MQLPDLMSRWKAGTAAGDGIVVEEGIAQGRDITVRQGTVAGQVRRGEGVGNFSSSCYRASSLATTARGMVSSSDRVSN